MKIKKWTKELLLKLPYDLGHYLHRMINKSGYINSQNLRNKVVAGYEYSYKGFDEKKCIYVHIPKAGGVSLSMQLFGNLGGGHNRIKDYRLIFSKEEWHAYYKFTVVRNPWDRLVSAYFFLKEGGFDEIDKKWFDANLSKYKDFEDFVVSWLSKKNIYTWNHFIPQFEFVCIGNKIVVDKVLKLENMLSNIAEINKKLNTNINSSHENKTKSRESDYRVYYTDRTKKIVEEIYRNDIEMFNYEF
jgi:hypothetical protein